MTTKTFCGETFSALGFGAMRLPVIDGDNGRIDTAAAEAMVDYAMDHGITYYDTAWGYHGGQSEIVMGKALAKYPRDSFFLASKFPGYDLANMPKVREIFERQLEKCGVDYFDFYLFHNVCEMNIDAYLDDAKYGIYSYLMEQKKNGRIRHLGFSIHGSYDVFRRFLNAYGKDMEFCQVQMNYVDWTLQDAQAKLKLLESMHIPMWVMEPLRGGRLARLSEQDTATLRDLRPDESIPAWAFRFIQTLPNTGVTLSGMSDMDQLRENIAIFETERPLNDTEYDTLLSIADGMLDGALSCTSCHYCVSHCPQQLDIPMLLNLYNEHTFTGRDGFIAPMALASLPPEKQPSACVGCGSCEQVCPQQLKIAGAMADFAKMLKN